MYPLKSKPSNPIIIPSPEHKKALLTILRGPPIKTTIGLREIYYPAAEFTSCPKKNLSIKANLKMAFLMELGPSLTF